MDIERLLARIEVKMVVCGDAGVKRVPDGDRKGKGGPGNLTRVCLDEHGEL